MSGWGEVREILNAGIAASQAVDRVTYYARGGPRTISAVVLRDTEELDVNIPRVIADVLAADLDVEPIGRRITYDDADYTIRELYAMPDGWVQLVMHRS